MRSHKCGWCKKYVGESFKHFADGVIDDGKYYFCDISCDTLFWLNTWANCNKNKQCVVDNMLTEFGKGYHQACKDIFNRMKKHKVISDVQAHKSETGDKE